MGKLPRVGKSWVNFNETVYRPITSLQVDAFEGSYQAGLRHGLTHEQAMAVAADDATKIIPRVSFRRLGQSQADAARNRALLTSVSFLTQPASLMNDATKGLLKIGFKQTITPTEAFAIRRVMTLTATIEGIAVLSNAYYAKTHDLDVEQAIQDSLNPLSGKFMSLVLTNGSKIGLGGPYRSIIRAVVPQEVPGVPVPIPFAGLPQFARGKVGPALGIAYDEIRNKDFYDRQIRTGTFPVNVLEGLEYALEGSLPLTAGTAAQEARQGASPGQIGQQTASQFLGTNLSPQSVRDVRDAVAWEEFGLHWSALTPAQEGVVNEDPRVQDRREEQAREKGPRSPIARAFDIRKQATANQVADDALVSKGEMTAKQWLENRATRRADVASRMDELFRNVKFPEEKRTILDDYYEKITQVKAEHNGVLDAAAWDEVDEWTSALPEVDQRFIDENTGVGPATAREKEYRSAQKLINKSNYFDPYKRIPRFQQEPALQSQYEEYLDAKRTETLPQWIQAGGDLKEMERWDRVTNLVKKEMRAKTPELDKALVKFYGTSPKTAEGRRLLAQTKPLEALTDISARGAARLNAAGIYSLDDFLAADPNTLLQTLGTSRKAIRNMRREARELQEGK